MVYGYGVWGGMGIWHMVEGIWGNFKSQIEKFKIPTALLLRCSAALLYPIAFHAFTLHAKKSPLSFFKKQGF